VGVGGGHYLKAKRLTSKLDFRLLEQCFWELTG
jgi:hypothetical protein